jgi:hypothetical protein
MKSNELTFTELHNDDEFALVVVAGLVSDNVRMTQMLKQLRLLKGLFLLTVRQLRLHDLLGNEVDLLGSLRWVAMLNQEGSAEVTPANALELLELLGVRVLWLVCISVHLVRVSFDKL